jgi:hypothetical protein
LLLLRIDSFSFFSLTKIPVALAGTTAPAPHAKTNIKINLDMFFRIPQWHTVSFVCLILQGTNFNIPEQKCRQKWSQTVHQ